MLPSSAPPASFFDASGTYQDLNNYHGFVALDGGGIDPRQLQLQPPPTAPIASSSRDDPEAYYRTRFQRPEGTTPPPPTVALSKRGFEKVKQPSIVTNEHILSSIELEQGYMVTWMREDFVPIPNFSNTSTEHPYLPIVFEPTVAHEGSKSGILMSLCLKGEGLHDPKAPVLEKLVGNKNRQLSFTIGWPGYDLKWVVDMSVYGRGPVMTRRELAHGIAIQYQEYAKTCIEKRLLCTNEEWRITEDGPVSFDNMKLAMFWFAPETNLWHVSVRVRRPVSVLFDKKTGLIVGAQPAEEEGASKKRRRRR